MESEKIQVEMIQKVAVITMNNPPANALSPELRFEFTHKLTKLSQNDDVWVLIITGSGEKFFAAGADIHSLIGLDRKGGLERVKKAREFYSGIAYFKKPVICAINGLCMGGGLELALACDIRIAAEHVKLGFPEVNLGLIPGAGGTQRLPRTIGPGWANYLFFTGKAISAQKALSIGLIQEMVPSDQLMTTALEIADRINSKGPLAVQAAKMASSRGLQETLEKGLDIENEGFAEICETLDKTEGVKAFIEKRKPQFKGK
ncbi:MAG: enoyl-CoA hydratase-related protein [Pseudomonadota bacterium]